MMQMAVSYFFPIDFYQKSLSAYNKVVPFIVYTAVSIIFSVIPVWIYKTVKS